MPAGAGCPLLVTAVAVVTFFMIVLLKRRTFGASSSAMPPPSCVDTLFTIMLLNTFWAHGCILVTDGLQSVADIRNRMPPPSSLARLAWTTLSWMETAPEPGERIEGSVGSWPAIMMPPPSS